MDGGAHRRDTGCLERSSVTLCAINLGVSFLTLRADQEIFFILNTVQPSRGILRVTDKTVSLFLLFYRRADTGPEKLRHLRQ